MSSASWNWRHDRTSVRRCARSHRRIGSWSSNPCRRGPRPRPSERAIGGKRPGPAMADGRLFSLPAEAAFTSRSKIAAPRHPPLALRPLASLRGAGPVRPPPFVAMKAAMGAADPTKRSTTMTHRHTTTPATSRRTPHPRPITSSPNSSSTAIAPSRTNPTRDRCPKPRSSPAPSPTSSTPLSCTLSDTRLEPDLDDLLWSTVNLFHRAAGRIERESRRQRAGAEAQPAGAERLRGPLGRTSNASPPKARR